MSDSREKERDRSKRGDRPSRFSDANNRDRSNDRGDRPEGKRLFVSNIPYEYRWTELKDLFKDKVGDVAYVELFNDENGKPRGCGVVEFSNPDAMKKALSVMHRYELNGRKLVLKEETGNERNRMHSSSRGGGGGGGGGGGSGGGGGGGGGGRGMREDKDWNMNKNMEPENFNTYGLSLQFLDSINVQPPLVKKVFVANLDYKADRPKIKEIFKMAGKVRNIDLAVDKDGNSRGFAVIEYDHPVEAVQAISMFDKQTLYDRRMTVRMDRGTDKSELHLPEGLKGIGLGLGPNGEPLRDVARNLPQSQPATTNMNLAAPNAMGAGVLGAVPNAGVALNGLGAGLAANTLNTNAAALGNSLGLQALGLTGLGALQNQLLQQGLNAAELTSVLQAHAAQQAVGGGGGGLSELTSGLLGSGALGGGALGGGALGAGVLGGGALGGGAMSGGAALNSGFGSAAGKWLEANNSRQMSSVSNNQGYNNSKMSSDYQSQDTMKVSSMYGRETSSQQQKPSDMVIISNLPSSVTWQLIREKFSECGEVKFAEMTAPDTAIVRFQKEWDADRAIKMFDRTRIDGRTIDVRLF